MACAVMYRIVWLGVCWVLGAVGAAIAFIAVPTKTLAVVVVLAIRLDTGQSSQWIERLRALNDDRITFHTFAPVGDGLESRLADSRPWTGGAWISFDPGLIATTTNAYCTLGFTWKKWSTNVLYGGTANHCTGTGGAWVTFYNNTNLVGTAAFTSPASDGMLLGGTSYSPTVFVGSQSTTDIRQVKGLDTSWDPGDAVAMSGARSGLRTARVELTHYYDPCKHWYLTLMDHWVSQGGDSGGPWLTTMSANSSYPGAAVAHGQHVGRGCDADQQPVLGSEFMPLSTISSALSASIYISPAL